MGKRRRKKLVRITAKFLALESGLIELFKGKIKKFKA
jgi:hypothetical protein